MGFKVFKTDLIDFVSGIMLKLNSVLQRVGSCWMALFISNNSYAPGGVSISKQSDIHLYTK